MRVPLGLAALCWLVLAAPAGAATVTDAGDTLAIDGGSARVVVQKAPWRLSLADAHGTTLVSEADPSRPDPPLNPDYLLDHDTYQGIDLAYPGLPSVSYQPLAFRRGGAWQHVTALRSWRRAGAGVVLTGDTSDGASADVAIAFGSDGTVSLSFRPPEGTDAVSEAWTADPQQRYVGGGQRFEGVDLTGRSVPLWVSHGVGASRGYSTNEIAIPFLMATGGWGVWARGTARGELDVAVPSERPDALSVVLEDDHLDLELFTGTPARMLGAFTKRSGRPAQPPPDWALRPMFWQDTDITQESTLAYVKRIRDAGIPIGAYWIDNPWESHHGDFAPSPAKFPDFDAMVRSLNADGVHVMAWASPFVPADDPWRVTGAPANDATYLPPRGLEAHADLTDPRAVERMIERTAALVRRGVEGFKLDRGEEDLGEDAHFHDGRPNRLVHNWYVERYDHAIYQGCHRAKTDCFIIGRGGVAGTARWAANWAADNPTGPGPLGIGQALNSLLSLSLSGQPVSGSDIGGYVGTRKDSGVGTPTKGTFVRWMEMGALSPVMESANDPTSYDTETVDIVRRYAVLHDKLAPSIRRWAVEAIGTGMPIVRPLLLAYPDDPVAVRVDDEYMLGPDLLVAPIVDPVSDTGPDARHVYLPAGGWTDAWTGMRVVGPTVVPVVAALDTLPLYVRDGARLPAGLFAG